MQNHPHPKAANRAFDVPFPGTRPGQARIILTPTSIRVENNVLGATWRIDKKRMEPAVWSDKVTGNHFEQAGCELFRLNTTAPAPAQTDSALVTIQLSSSKVIVSASQDGIAWTELASYPRADFLGLPRLIRIGKMNLKAEAKSHSLEGLVGESVISELSPKPPDLANGMFTLRAKPHESITHSYAFPTNATLLTARIAKGTDTGLSWAPAIALIWNEGKQFVLVGIRDKPSTFNVCTVLGERIIGVNLEPYPSFNLPAARFVVSDKPVVSRRLAAPMADHPRDRHACSTVTVPLTGPGGLQAIWSASLSDDAGYIRQTLTVRTSGSPIVLTGVEFINIKVPEPTTVGTAPGCPVAAGNRYFGVEMPGARNALSPTGARIGFAATLPLSGTTEYTFGAVSGVAPKQQLRRAFLHYVERERARASTPFLHYNCWYDLGYGVDEGRLLRVVEHYDRELVKKRNVPVQSYLVDDGWDDTGRGLWADDLRKFPQGLPGLAKRMRKFGANLAIWISPLGGYGGDHERTQFARTMGLIPKTSSLDLAYPAYKAWFLKRCTNLMQTAGVNAFKWDRAGDGVSPHFMALLDIARSLRKVNPKVFINVTVGTWPSPFWLNHVDCTWRNGSADVGWLGKGSDGGKSQYNRERWLTFRDGECRRMFVQASPLYPLNSVMHHGIVYGREFQGGSIGNANPPELRNEVRSYFASGATLQELYLTPEWLDSASWDALADAAKWAHANADVLVDAHWIGGDPLKLEVYGYAAWNTRKGTVMLRNPDDRPQKFPLDIGLALELPVGSPTQYHLVSPFIDQRLKDLRCSAGIPTIVDLAPFEVVVFDARVVNANGDLFFR